MGILAPLAVWRSHPWQLGRSLPDSDSAGPYVAELASLGYSCRAIEALWREHGTNRGALDQTPRVRRLRQQLRYIRSKPLSYSAISRILKKYSFEYAEGTVPNTDDIFGLELPSRVTPTPKHSESGNYHFLDDEKQ